MQNNLFTAEEMLKQCRLLEYEPDFRFATPLATEWEYFTYYSDGTPVDLTAHIDHIKGAPDLYSGNTDLGKNQFEVACERKHEFHDYCESMVKIFRYFAENGPSKQWKFLISGTAQKTLGRVYGPLYDCKIEALQKEDPERGKDVEWCMTTHAAFQINIGVSQFIGDVSSEESAKILYAFGNWGPALCIHLEHLTGDLNSMRLRDAYKFATDIRGFRYMDWDFCKNIKERLFEVPQLMRQTPGEKWEVYLGKPNTLDWTHTGGIYWPARPRGILTQGECRIEVRSISSLSLLHSAYVVRLINSLVKYVLDTDVHELPILNTTNWHTLTQKKDLKKVTKLAHEFLQQLPVSLLWSI